MNRILVLLAAALPLTAAEPKVQAPVTGVAMFKNGMAMVTRVIEQVPNGPFLLEGDLRPVHGTLWFEPSDGITLSTVKVTETKSEKKAVPFGQLLKKWAGRDLEITFMAGTTPITVRGTLQGDPDTPALREKDGSLFVLNPACAILSVRSRDGNLPAPETTEVKTEKTYWRIVKKTRSAGPLRIHYLTTGMTWAPSYKIDLTDPKTLSIGQSLLLINDLEDLKGADAQVVSGYPHLLFSRVVSPLAAGVDIHQFFKSLNSYEPQFYRQGSSITSQIRMNYASPDTSRAPESALGASLPATGKAEDIHFSAAGPLTLAKGERLYRAMDNGTAPYERIVEWKIPDTRNEYGWYNGNSGEKPTGELWDAVRFQNPLSAPITTAPLEFTANGRLLAQNQTNWVNPGQEAVFRITKALTMAGNAVESEEAGNRTERIRIGGNDYRTATVKGTVSVRNYRADAAKAVITLRFSGELLSAQGDPKVSKLQAGIWGVNPRNELRWEVDVPAGKDLVLEYRYSVLIRY